MLNKETPQEEYKQQIGERRWTISLTPALHNIYVCESMEELTTVCSRGSISRNRSRISLFSQSLAKRERALTAEIRITGTLSPARNFIQSITSSQSSLLTSASSGNCRMIYKSTNFHQARKKRKLLQSMKFIQPMNLKQKQNQKKTSWKSGVRVTVLQWKLAPRMNKANETSPYKFKRSATSRVDKSNATYRSRF